MTDTYRAVVTDRALYEAAPGLLNRVRDELLDRSGARHVDSARLSVVRSPNLYAYEMEVVFESVAWTGRVAPDDLGPDHAWWKIGPVQWRRAGVVAMLNTGPLALPIIGRRWHLVWLK